MAIAWESICFPLLTMWPDHKFLKSRLVFHMFSVFYSDIIYVKNKKTQTFALINAFFFSCGLTSFLQSLQCLISMLPIAVKHQNGSSSKQYSSWAYSLISCIISSRTFVTNTTYIGFQFGGFCSFFFLGMIPVLIHIFFSLNILHNTLLKKVLCLRQKVFVLHSGGANAYYFLKEVSGCLCGHPQRG